MLCNVHIFRSYFCNSELSLYSKKKILLPLSENGLFDEDMQDAFFKVHRPIGALLGVPIILNLRKFFTYCFQNLAQRFIGIQEYANDIVFKKKEMSLGPLGAP